MHTAIRTFRHGGLHGEHRYRHAMSFHTDEVLLQRMSRDGEWESLLRFDSNAVAWNMAGERVGLFVTSEGHWLFRPTKALNHWPIINCESTRGAESLLDSEVTISKRWLDSQEAPPKGGADG